MDQGFRREGVRVRGEEERELGPDELDEQRTEVVTDREALSLLTPGSGGAFGLAAASEVAAESSPTDDVMTIQSEDDA